MTRVYLISTFEDLIEYRKSVVDSIVQLGMTPIVFEQFASGTESVNEVIKKQIIESDILVLIVGHRYGFVPVGENKSLIEIEYDLARELEKPILIFIIDDQFPWQPKYIDQDPKKINDFKQRLKSHHLVSFFTSPSDLAVKVTSSLLSFSSRLHKDVRSEFKKTVRDVKIVRLLLSSPGDVSEERSRVSQAVFRFNQESVEAKGLFIKLIRWEDMAPQIGPGAQDVINKQIEDYHLFIGIMWNRFGTPTDVAASGTQEEFNAAVNLWKASRKPWITFYFCERPSNFTTPEQLDQKRQVLEFRNQLYTMGVVRSFNLAEEFEDLVYRDLLRITSLSEFNKLL